MTTIQFMKNSKDFFDDFDSINNLPVIRLEGEIFYIQLFVDFNICKHAIYSISPSSKIYIRDSKSVVYQSLKDYLDEYFDSIVVYCGLDGFFKTQFKKIPNVLVYDFFNNPDIYKNGSFYFDNVKYIVDDVKYIESCPHYLKEVYDHNDYSTDYIVQLSMEPGGRYKDSTGDFKLYDYKDKYISHVNGRRFTKCSKSVCIDHYIHFFGDSRVSGYMLEDKDLFTNLFQDKLDNSNKKSQVINYGIPGREIDRMYEQLFHSHLKKNDIVIFMTACNDYRDNAKNIQERYFEYLHKSFILCRYKGVKFLYINLPVTTELGPSLLPVEKEIDDLYHRYKFFEYDFEEINNYKKKLFKKLEDNKINYYDMAELFKEIHPKSLFINMHHYSPHANKVISDKIYELCKQLENIQVDKIFNFDLFLNSNFCKLNSHCKKILYSFVPNGFIKRNLRMFLDIKTSCPHLYKGYKLYSFIRELKKILCRRKEIGAIVMNGNPYTMGHSFLVESALKQVKFLYVFVLQEDESDYSFKDRFSIIYSNLKKYKNVRCCPSGYDIISLDTFPEYFEKKELQNEEIKARKDIESFGCNVSRLFRIGKRFVGTEPTDKVTDQYNNQMKILLPKYDIDFVEIKRKSIDKKFISASLVRELISTHNLDELKKFISSETFEYLKHNDFI